MQMYFSQKRVAQTVHKLLRDTVRPAPGHRLSFARRSSVAVVAIGRGG